MIDINKVRACNTRILVLPDALVDQTAGGVIIADDNKERPQIGTVIAIGKKVTYINKGDRVLYGKNVGTPFKLETEQGVYTTYYIMHDSEIAMTIAK